MLDCVLHFWGILGRFSPSIRVPLIAVPDIEWKRRRPLPLETAVWLSSAPHATASQTMGGDAGGHSPRRQPQRYCRLTVLRRPSSEGGKVENAVTEGRGRPLTGEVTVEGLRQLELRGGQPPWTGLRVTGLVGSRGAPATVGASLLSCRGRRRRYFFHCLLGLRAEGRLDLVEKYEAAP